LAKALTSDYPSRNTPRSPALASARTPMIAFLKQPVVRSALLFIACVLSIAWPKLAPGAAFMVLVVGLSLPKLLGTERRWAWGLLWAATLVSCFAFMRFVLEQAVPGVIAGGKAAAAKHAISFARTLVTAQDHARSFALFDPDDDGVGSALELPALAGLALTRAGTRITTPPLSLRPEQIKDTARGPALEEAGYLFQLCLPVGNGRFSVTPGPNAVDEEAAERDYILYGWPASNSPGSPIQAVTVDANERILVTPADGDRRYYGADNGPDCSASVTDPGWTEWKAAREPAAPAKP
jgi:hypothetical protein